MFIKKKSLKDVDTSSDEGKMLIAAMAVLTTQTYTDKTPDDVLEKLVDLTNYMYSLDFLQEMDVRKSKLVKIINLL